MARRSSGLSGRVTNGQCGPNAKPLSTHLSCSSRCPTPTGTRRATAAPTPGRRTRPRSARGRPRELLASGGVVGERGERPRDRGRIQCHEDARVRRDDLRDPADPGGDRGQLHGHRPQHGGRQRGRAGRVHEEVRGREQFGGLAVAVGEPHPVGQRVGSRDPHSSHGRSGPSPASASTSGRSSGSASTASSSSSCPWSRRIGAVERATTSWSSTSSAVRRRARVASSGTPGSTTPFGTSRTSVSGPARLRYHSRCTWEMAIVRVMNRWRARILALRLSRSTRSAGSL